MATHSSVLAWRISGTAEPGGLPSVGSHRVGHDWSDLVVVVVVVKPINNGVIVAGEQWRDSAIHVHVSILFQTPLPSRLPHNIEQSSMCCTVGPCWLSILNIAVCTCPVQTLTISSLPYPHKFVLLSLWVFLFCKFICIISF